MRVPGTTAAAGFSAAFAAGAGSAAGAAAADVGAVGVGTEPVLVRSPDELLPAAGETAAASIGATCSMRLTRTPSGIVTSRGAAVDSGI